MHLDIVMPAHDEAHRIDRTLDRYRAAVRSPLTRFVVALDGCTDGTAAVVQRHAEVDERVHCLELPKLGKGGAVAAAVRRSDAPVVAYVDADGATPPSELLRLADAVLSGGADIAIASRRLPASVNPVRRRSARRLASAGFAAAVHGLFRLPQSDTQCGAKALSSTAARQVMPMVTTRDFLFDVDLLVAAERTGLRVEEVPTVWIDQDGSKVDPLRDTLRMARSALRLWARLHLRPRPTPPPLPVPDAPGPGDQLGPASESGLRITELVGP